MLSVKNLSISFNSNTEQNKVVHNVSFELKQQQILGIVGESGSGKSVTSLAILGLLSKNAKIEGAIFFNDINLKSISEKEFQKIRGNQISMIFQEPMSSLNPSLTCGYQVLEILLQHKNISKSEAKNEVIELFNKVKLPRAETIFEQYPHQISGGQKQRVMIAMAIACKPDILIADEPTTALDVTVQKDIIALLKTLQKECKMSVIFISHDLALVSEIADRILVMYQGSIIESGPTKSIFKTPKEDYTKALIGARPTLKSRLKQLPTISDFLSNTISKSVISKNTRAKKHKEIYSQAPLLEVINLEKIYFSNPSFFGTKTAFKAVDTVSFKVYAGETMGLVGESGCGKSTLGKAILQLDKATAGTLNYKGKVIGVIPEFLKKYKDKYKDIDAINEYHKKQNSNNYFVFNEDGSYLRLKTITLGYNIPVSKSAFKSLRLALSGQNLYTWTNYSGFDPEVELYYYV